MTHSEQLNELAAALCAAQAEFVAIPKTDDNPFFKSKFAGLPTVVKTASPILTKHGLSVSQFLGADEHGHDTLTTWLLHKSGQFIADSMPLHLVKNDPQGQGSATTYARRYSYMSALGLVADADDDGNAASRPGRQQAAARPQPQAQPNGGSERAASASQRGLIFARADEHKLPNSGLANVVLAATGNDPRDFESEDHAGEWLKRSLDRLPARKVNDVLEGIEKTGALL